MSEPTLAEKLRISEGFVVWIIGGTVEEASILDPLPEGVELIEQRDEEFPESVDAAIIVARGSDELGETFDDVLPQLGSIQVVWVAYAIENYEDLDETSLQELVADYGWYAVESVVLDDTWAALRFEP
jgi:hypothetical protein